MVTEHGVILSIGPVLTEDRADDSLAQWANELIGTTRSISLSVVIASPSAQCTPPRRRLQRR